MIKFPESAQNEWKIIADAAEVDARIRRKIAHDTLVERELERMRQRHEAKVLLDQELNAARTPALNIISGTDFMNTPTLAPPTDLIDGVAKNKGMCILLGPGGTGKTTLALQMLHSLSTGTDWLGQTTKPLTGSMGILSFDQDASITLDWLAQTGTDMSRVSLMDAYTSGNPLAVPEFRSQLVEAWRRSNVEIIVLDSFTASFFGENQNDPTQMMAYYRDIKQFALQEVGAAGLIVIAHSTEANPRKVRGSSVHTDAADSMVAVWKDQQDQRHIEMTKYRAGRGQQAMSPIIITQPDSVTHLVDVDAGAMTLAGLQLPPSVGGQMFDAMPDTYEEPNTDSISEFDDSEEDDL